MARLLAEDLAGSATKKKERRRCPAVAMASMSHTIGFPASRSIVLTAADFHRDHRRRSADWEPSA